MPKCQTCTLNSTKAQRLQWRTHWWHSPWSNGCIQSGWMSSSATKRRRTHKVGSLLASQTHLVVISNNTPASSLLSTPQPPPVHLLALCCPALRSSYEEEEAHLPKLEDLEGAAKGLMRLQDVYALQVESLVRGRFQRVTNGKPLDIYLPTVSTPLSGDDCFLVGKVLTPSFSFTISSYCFFLYFLWGKKLLHLKKNINITIETYYFTN